MNTKRAASMTLDRSDASATVELYRAALGPVQVDYYLKVFTRFDAAGKVSPGWNWGAALVTLNWMAFYRLWGHALAYVGASTAACLLLFGILPLLYPMSHGGLWTLLVLNALVAVAVPGAFGNAWLYAACNKTMDAAYSASATQEDACALLRRNAVGRHRLGGLAAGNLALFAAAATIVLSWPRVGSLPLNTNRMEQARMQPATLATAQASEPVPALATTAAIAPHSEPSAATAAAPIAGPASAPKSAPASARVAAASQPAGGSRSSQGLVQMPAPSVSAQPTASAPSVTAADNAAKAKLSAKQKSDSALAAATEQHAAALAARKAAEQISRMAAQAEQATRTVDAADAAKAVKTAKATTVAKVAKPAAAASAAGSEQYVVNVGVFADANNARNAYTKLMDAGLPAQSQTFTTAKGERTRVRVGSFESRAEADTAADKIRALAFDAVVSKP